MFLSGAIEAYVDIDYERQELETRTADLDAWLEMIGPGSARLIKSLTIYMPLPLKDCLWDPDYDCDSSDCWRPTSSKDVCTHLGLYLLGVEPSAVRGLFGAHMRDYDFEDDYKPFRDAPWQAADDDLELGDLWWTPVPGEQRRNGDNGIWDEDDNEEEDGQSVKE